MKWNKILVLLCGLMIMALMTGLVSAGTDFASPTPTASELVRSSSVSIYAVSDQGNASSITISLYKDLATDVLVSTHTESANNYTLAVTGLYPGDYYATAYSTNESANVTATNRSFTISSCNDAATYAMWGILTLVFIVGMLYFTYTALVEGRWVNLLGTIVLLAIAVAILGSTTIPLLKTVC
jgi:hypothetical protein